MAEIDDLREQLADTRVELEKVKLRATTTLSGAEFLTLIMLAPVVAAFVILGTTIIWKATSNPASVAPHLDIILVAFAIFATPVGAGLAAITARFAEEGKRKEQ
jgi:predicted small integral membrane protein